eukprot:Lankesteria_metandrocarpae@DN3537_c0_g1_i2.p1
MGGLRFRQYKSLLYRAAINRMRTPVRSVLEILIPIGIMLGLTFIRRSYPVEYGEVDAHRFSGAKYNKCLFGAYGDWPLGALSPANEQTDTYELPGGQEVILPISAITCQDWAAVQAAGVPVDVPALSLIDVLPFELKRRYDGKSKVHLGGIITSQNSTEPDFPVLFIGDSCDTLKDFFDSSIRELNPTTYPNATFVCPDKTLVPPECTSAVPSTQAVQYSVYTTASDPRIADVDSNITAAIFCNTID